MGASVEMGVIVNVMWWWMYWLIDWLILGIWRNFGWSLAHCSSSINVISTGPIHVSIGISPINDDDVRWDDVMGHSTTVPISTVRNTTRALAYVQIPTSKCSHIYQHTQTHTQCICIWMSEWMIGFVYRFVLLPSFFRTVTNPPSIVIVVIAVSVRISLVPPVIISISVFLSIYLSLSVEHIPFGSLSARIFLYISWPDFFIHFNLEHWHDLFFFINLSAREVIKSIDCNF